MADLESLNYKSITEMTNDEALEHIRQLRLRRRIPDKPKKQSKRTTSKKETTKSVKSLTPEEAANLLMLLED